MYQLKKFEVVEVDLAHLTIVRLLFAKGWITLDEMVPAN